LAEFTFFASPILTMIHYLYALHVSLRVMDASGNYIAH